MKLSATLLLILSLVSSAIFAQNAHFSTDGIVEYDKTVNMFAVMKKTIDKDNESYMQQAYDNYKRNQPQFKVLKSTLAFSKDKTLFTPIEPENGNSSGFGASVMADQNNVIYNDFTTGLTTAQKKVYEETFLVKDTTRKINWKITSETRDIAGFKCRRANALILDSIYVVAFYTDEIPISGGPESFNGLPGMILGVALPHENVTWFATKVTDILSPAKPLAPPAKGKPTNNKELAKTIQAALKDWGSYGPLALKAFSF